MCIKAGWLDHTDHPVFSVRSFNSPITGRYQSQTPNREMRPMKMIAAPPIRRSRFIRLSSSPYFHFHISGQTGCITNNRPARTHPIFEKTPCSNKVESTAPNNIKPAIDHHCRLKVSLLITSSPHCQIPICRIVSIGSLSQQHNQINLINLPELHIY